MSSHICIAVQETETIATYMKSKFAEMLWNMGPRQLDRPEVAPYPKEWSLEYAVEVDLAVSIITQAFNKQGILTDPYQT
jgi:hypothetical protein